MNRKKLILLLALGLVSCMVNAQDLRSSSNSFVGKIESDGTIRNGSNSSIGKVESDGTVRKNGSSVGKIDKDGTVRNSSNATIGYAKGVSVQHAAVYFFFDFFKK
jgi:hypothetical protein